MVLYVLHQLLFSCHGVFTGEKRWPFYYITFSLSRFSFLVDITFFLYIHGKVTCHPSFIGDLPTFRAVESNVQISGELTTSRGPGTTFQFALSFVKQLFGPHAAEDMESTLVRNKKSLHIFAHMLLNHYE
jgi:hypothetical protein